MTTHNELEDELSRAAILRELEEARIRECQMEKTVRWWTACTAGWRQKWSKVRHERDSFKRQANMSNVQLNSVLNEIQQLIGKHSNEENSNLVTKLENLLQKYRPKEAHATAELLYEDSKPVEEEELDQGTGDPQAADYKMKSQHPSKSERSGTKEDFSVLKDQVKCLDATVSSKVKPNSSYSGEQEKNESLLEIMSDELESIASEKKRLHKDIDNLKSKKIALKQELRVSQLELDTLKEQLLSLKDVSGLPEASCPDLDKDRLIIENSTLRSQIRDLCYEICIAQEEIDKVSEQIIQLKEKNEEFLEHKITCVKEIERLNLRLQLCGFYNEPISSERL